MVIGGGLGTWLLGCQPPETSGGEMIRAGEAGREVIEDGWPYWPVEIRLHPLSRLVVAPGQRVLEARVEFMDADGISSRAHGRLRIDLHPEAQRGLSRPKSTWEVDLRDLERNYRHFDPVTRTYLLRLETEAMELPESPELRAYFLSEDGSRLEARMRLRTGGR
jgi:hypothetical protein